MDFGAADTQQDVAGRIVAAINGNTPLRATASGNAVVLQGAAFVASADPPLRIGGTAPGGNFTGLAIVDGVLYGVTGPDEFRQGGGGLFRILGPRTNGAVADYVETSTDLLTGGRNAFGEPTGEPIQFAALSAGPDNLEDGRFANILFGMDIFGNLYAFDLTGKLQPVFMNSQPSVPTGIFNATGFSFSTLDMNLWHVTDQRREDAGHGWAEAPDGSREAEQTAGNTSLYFGFQNPDTQPGNWGGINDPVIRNSYDFPGGAQGSITTNTFSLRDYDSTDRPTLYFNYFLATEGAGRLHTAALHARFVPRVHLGRRRRVAVAGDQQQLSWKWRSGRRVRLRAVRGAGVVGHRRLAPSTRRPVALRGPREPAFAVRFQLGRVLRPGTGLHRW